MLARFASATAQCTMVQCTMALCTTVLCTATLCTTATAQLPPPYQPAQNPGTHPKVMLGKILFWDEQLSSDDTIACGTCHLPEFGGSDARYTRGVHPGPDGLYATADDIHGSPGVARQTNTGDFTPDSIFGMRAQVTGRVAPTNLGVAHHGELFWDGRATSQFVDPETSQVLIPFGGALESQAVGPILSPVEMGVEGRTWQDVRQKLQHAVPLRLATNLTPDVVAALQSYPTYPALFQAAFGTPVINAGRIGFALAAYQRTLNPDDTPWDRFRRGTGTLTPNQLAGWNLFLNQGRCVACHWDPLFSDNQFHNLGLRPANEDRGRGAVTQSITDKGSFKTPTLRNAGLRRRLFHNGQSVPLSDTRQLTDPLSVLNIYFEGGGVDRSNLDPFLLPLGELGVSRAELQLINDFVTTALTDQRAARRLPPFDHPDLRSMVQPPPRVFGQGLQGAFEPFFVDTVPAYPGNADYKLGLAASSNGNLAMLAYGFQSFEPSIVAMGLPWNLQAQDFLPFVLSARPGEQGRATWRLPIPKATVLPLPLYFQLFAFDQQAPGGLAASRGLELFIR
jgi:cytochrome c peroxidase